MKDMTLMDMEITVGHIIANPNFDCNCNVLVFDDDGDEEPTLYDGDGMSLVIPTDILIRPVTYISMRNHSLAIGTRAKED